MNRSNKNYPLSERKADSVVRWSFRQSTFLWLPIVIILSIIFVTALVLPLNQSDYVNFQKSEFLSINRFLMSDSDFWLNITQLGDAMILFPLLSLLIPKYPQIWAALFGAVPVSALLSIGGKNLFDVPRPAAVLDHNLFNIMGDTLTAYNSLPSGHTITVFTAATVVLGVLFPLPNKKQHFIWLAIGSLLAFFVALSRVAVGAHWPLDVALGSVLGYLGGLSGIILTQRYQRWWQWMASPKYQFILSLQVFLFVIAIVYNLSDPDYSKMIILWIAAVIGALMSLYLFLRPTTK
ncbi:MAG: phosphatase PAP2 family protein [Cocleimonas sp.]